MTTNTTSIPLTEQVRQALATFDDAHRAAEAAAAAYVECKVRVGSNEKQRAQAEKDTSPAIYAEWMEQYRVAEATKVEAAAHLERVEKNLNVLRELLQAENVSIQRAWAEIADRTAMRYAALQLTLPARPVVMRVEKTPDQDDLPF